MITSHLAPSAPFPAAASAAFALAAALAFLSAWRPPVSSDACSVAWDWLPVSFETCAWRSRMDRFQAAAAYISSSSPPKTSLCNGSSHGKRVEARNHDT